VKGEGIGAEEIPKFPHYFMKEAAVFMRIWKKRLFYPLVNKQAKHTKLKIFGTVSFRIYAIASLHIEICNHII
jgi:hypothetical protein